MEKQSLFGDKRVGFAGTVFGTEERGARSSFQDM
jgi:hypothetical protein